MFFLSRPSPQTIERFLAASAGLPLSYSPVGLARSGAQGFRIDESLVTIGNGEAAYRRAVAALRDWTQFKLGWTELLPAAAANTPGTVVAILIRHLGFWSLNGARVVYSIGAPDAAEYGYAYGTLSNHAERGEEIFAVRFNQQTGDVTYQLRAASRPRSWLAAAGYPVTRALQARFRRDSAAAMVRFLAT